MVKSYGQYCALARTLDVVGGRWSPLIVRELLAGPRRYGELLAGLPGIATNLLADRLRHLEQAGVLARDEAGTYRLTAWGEGLREPLYTLARWGAPVVMTRPTGDDSYRADWLVHPVAVLFDGVDRRRAPLTVEVRVGGSAMTVTSREGRVTAAPGSAAAPDVVLAGPPDLLLGLLAGRIDATRAKQSGVQVTGDSRLLRRLRPPRWPDEAMMPAASAAD